MRPNTSTQMCRFCEKSMNLTYYCEGCGASCCSDCLNEKKIDTFTCQDCDSHKIEVDSSGLKTCKECGGENIVKITQHLKSCPKCHSHEIINVFEKKEELEQKFLELIKSTRNFAQPFRGVINKLNLLRSKVKKARDPPIKCYHYPRMEAELLTLFKLMIYVKNTLRDKISNHFRHLDINKEYFFALYTQPNSNIRIIEDILKNLNRSYNSIDTYLQDNLKNIEEKLGGFHKKLEFFEKISLLFETHKRYLNLAEEEKPVYAIKAKLANGLNTQGSYKKNKGILFITNFDLTFVHEHGIIKKKKEKIFKAPVQDLTKLQEQGTLFKKLYLEFSYGQYEFSLPSRTIPKIIEYILLARDFNNVVKNDPESANQLQLISITLSDLTELIEEEINSFFSIKCQYNNSFKHGQEREHENKFNDKRSHVHSSPQMQEFPSQWSKNHAQASGMANYKHNNPQYYSQDVFNPYKVQNYNPQGQEGSNRNHTTSRRQEYQEPSYYDEKKHLMRNLEKAQKYSSPNHPQAYKYKNPSKTPSRPRLDRPRAYSNNQPFFQEFNRSHLSNLFNSENNRPTHAPAAYNSVPFENESQQELLNLKREKFALKETLKKLDSRFEQGIISEGDYFRTFKNIQKDIFMTDRKIRELTNKANEEETIRLNLFS